MTRLEFEGDQFEKDYWSLFIKDKFPSYETFWLKFVFPLRSRGVNSFIQNTEPTPGNIPTSMHVAQLNYGVIRHLTRCFQILESLKITEGFDQYDLFIEGIVRLTGALDNGDELLARSKWPNDYIDQSADGLRVQADKARKRWRTEVGDPLKKIRYYRNRVIHGSPLSAIITSDKNRSICLPEVNKEKLYLDFRLVNYSPGLEKYKNDFVPVLRILESMWLETISYLEENWKRI